MRKACRSQVLSAVSGSVRCRLQPEGDSGLGSYNFLVFRLSFKTHNMFRRKLAALEYHQPNSFNIADEAQFRNMIVWLEDQKVRHYKIEDRANLRNIQSADWPTAFKQYLEELACPVNHGDKSAVMDWLLGYAVRLEYGDNVEKYRQVKAASVQKTPMPAPSADVLGSIDPSSADFRAGVASLAQLLQIPQHEDQLMLLKAIRKLIQEKLSKEAIAESQNKKTEGVPILLQDLDAGFDTGDPAVNEAAKILRLLHIHELRDLQTKINEAIVSVQAITANPKTDQALGKVGR
ncbi:RNA transcription, translation and transport factor protein-like isoform X1 [Branchiostoma floridae x Branchiostoma belcheri]